MLHTGGNCHCEAAFFAAEAIPFCKPETASLRPADTLPPPVFNHLPHFGHAQNGGGRVGAAENEGGWVEAQSFVGCVEGEIPYPLHSQTALTQPNLQKNYFSFLLM